MREREEGRHLPEGHGCKAAVVSHDTSALHLVSIVVALLVVEHEDIVDIVGVDQAGDGEGSKEEGDHVED